MTSAFRAYLDPHLPSTIRKGSIEGYLGGPGRVLRYLLRICYDSGAGWGVRGRD